MNVQDLYIEFGLQPLETVAGGNEWHGPCPACGGDKRFVVWRKRKNEGGDYWCRDCGKAGDNIQFMVDFMKMEYRDAFQRAGRPEAGPTSVKRIAPPSYRGRDIKRPEKLWVEKAGEFVEYAHQELLKNSDDMTYLAGRGINRESVIKHRLGYNPGKAGKYHLRPRTSWALGPRKDPKSGKPKKFLWFPAGIVIPNFCGGEVWSTQIRQPDGFEFADRYIFLEGGSNASFVLGHDRPVILVVEARLCAIAVFQAAGDLVGVFAAQTVGGHPDTRTHKILTNAVQILNALDYEDQAEVVTKGQVAVLRAVKRWKEKYPHCDRWPVPNAKDPGDAVKNGLDLRQWIKDGLSPLAQVRHRLQKQKEAGPVKRRSVKAAPQPAPGKPSQACLHPDVAELCDLLQRYPVRIYHSPERLAIVDDVKGWRHNHWPIFGRLSALVFDSDEVELVIQVNPNNWITGTNLVDGLA